MDDPIQPKAGFFSGAFNPLIDHWLSRLTPIELGVMLVYLRHADSDGSAYPSTARIARLVGHQDTKHVREARRHLAELGLLQCIDVGGGKNASRYRLNITIPAAPKAPPAKSPPPGEKRLPTPGENGQGRGGAFGPNTPGEMRPPKETIEGDHVRRPIKETKRDTPEVKPEIPETLNTPGFQTAWADFIKHRSQKRAGKLTPLAAQKQLARLEKIGPDRAVAAIDHSIAQGWTGVFEDKSRKPTSPTRREFAESADVESFILS